MPVEIAHLHGFGIDPNRRAERWAAGHGKPLVANSDTHDLVMLGRNFTEVEAESSNAPAIFDAIRRGRCQSRTAPISLWGLLRFSFGVILCQTLARLALRDGRRIGQFVF